MIKNQTGSIFFLILAACGVALGVLSGLLIRQRNQQINPSHRQYAFRLDGGNKILIHQRQ